ncbi:MAG: TonB-dependent receptor [Sphingobium sp.]|uniref:TonB-dependent receptor n=1 Tax=Sphingobium sp. TaxID=1912891 RepID=UPI000C35255F|nr:TonB-dependent receptor [Sphingobium sp.]MBU0657559.1 TonB-dependent receptor [Alphaproteobacteria bacterium]MBA4754274.1 TonB-dependent receptor [Sphingobium sp.]MBS86664.1 TonB-dependent receptor [Sphingobium sp.]MBU1794256.1 TonB-dependent receptor [Alphaproteobacteria bacterium]MBU2017263.1 TonB-dependent receptor [Alphaproteobacteria bacterium]
MKIFAVLLASSTAFPAIAQTAAPDAEVAGGEQIIVTAQKIEQRAMDVPITISAVSGKRMEQIGVSDLDELSNYIPGLNIQEQSANNPGIVIRGITSDSGSAQQAPRVTLYYNGIDISRSRGSYQDIYDMERIEVIKGPQATLFGTASAVGAISMISARPNPGFSAELTAGYGNYDSKLLSGFVNGGSDKVAGRIAFAWKKRDGYVKNLSATQDDLYARDQLGVRGSLRLKPTDSFTADLILTYDRQRNSGTPFISRALPTSDGPGNPFGAANLSGSPLSSTVLGGDKLGLHRDVYDANLTFSWDFADDWTLTMVNGYRKFDSNEVFDADGSAAWYLEFAEEAKGWQASHETRFAYAGDHFRGAFGWNLFREDNHQRVPFSTEEGTYLQCAARLIPGLPCVAANGTVAASQATAILTNGAATVIPYSSVFENLGKNDSYSMFADGTWLASPSLELTAGIRALIEERRSGYVTNVPNSVLTRAPLIPGQVNTNGRVLRTQGSFAAFLPRFNILYRFSPALNGFATVSKGRRSPTVNLDAAAGGVARINRIAEENVWNYEVGLKGNSGIFSGSLGVYYQTYDNFQVSVTGSDGVTRTVSAGTASNLGVEAEVAIQPTSWLNIFANGGYIDGGIDDKPANGRFAGDQFRLQPRFQAAAGFTIDAPMGNGMRVFATPSLTYRSKIYFEVPNSEAISQKGVMLVNLRAGVSFAEDRYEISAFVRNATDRNYLLDAGNTGGAFGIPTFIPAEPRFYGAQLTGRF